METGQGRIIKQQATQSRIIGTVPYVRVAQDQLPSYIRALIDKLAIEEVETYQAAAGLQGARVYRIYSFDEIRRRRRQAELTHVIRTGAVVFVDPHTGVQPQTRRRSSPSESSLLPASSLPSGGKFIPQPSSNLLDTPDSNLLPSSINNLEQQNVITSPTSEPPSSLEETVNELERLILQSPYSDFDRQAIIGIVKQSRERVPDITADEIFTLFQDKARSLIGNRRIENFNGMLIWAWNGFFSESRVNSLREAIRREKEQEQKRHEETIAMYRQFVNDASMPEEWREEARRYLATEGLLPGS